ncbi:MAG TPA: FtsX-like permease family protein, partial [Vicinamibacterales bacterium]
APRRRIDALALLAPGVTMQAAQERLDVIAADLNRARPIAAGWNVRLMPPRGGRVNDSTRRALEILFGAVTLVLLIACANVANLFLAQALARRREIAIRSALGATRWRLVRELLAESLLLAGAGGACGLALAWWGVGAAAALAPEQLTRWTATEIAIDRRVLFFTLGCSLATGLLFGILPALQASRSGDGGWLKGRTRTGSGGTSRTRHVLVVAEVALSVVLLVGAALLIRSFVRLSQVDVGFNPDNLLSITMSLPAAKYPQPPRRAFYDALTAAVKSMPGVQAVTLASGTPPTAGGIHFSDQFEAEGGRRYGQMLILPDTDVTPEYFATLGISLVEGRLFGANEPDESAIISRTMAEWFWPGESAIGRRVRLNPKSLWRSVVGVVGEVRQMGINESRPTQVRMKEAPATAFEMYSPFWTPEPAPASLSRPGGPRAFAQATFVVRAIDPMAIVPPIKAAVWAIDKDQPIGRVALVDHLMSDSIKEQRFALVLMTSFAALALVLAGAGLYATLSHLVLQRRQEIGIRMALGASVRDVLRLIVSRGAALAGVGLAIGLLSAAALSRYMASQLYEVEARDPLSFFVVALALLAIAIVACVIPTRRALSVDPAAALRAE